MKKQDFTVLKIADLHPFPDNPFRVVEDEMLMELAESIKELGIVTPIITRPMEDGNGYEVIAGQRRVRACELAGIDTVPAFVLPLDRDRAIITLVDSNIQRENILPSERAFAYKMKLEAMKRQGFRTDLTSSQLGTKLRTDDIVAQGFGVGKTTVQRFIRLTVRRIYNMLVIKVENGCEAPPVAKQGELITSKTEGGLHGWGLKSVRAAAEKYDGIVETMYEDHVFRAVVTLSFEAVNME